MALTSSPIQCNPDFENPFLVQTDASEISLGVVHSQEFDRQAHPIVYITCKLTAVEHCYATIKREALAIKLTVEAIQYYLTGRHFMLVTDHAPLQWLAWQKNTNNKISCCFLSLHSLSFRVLH